MGKGIYDYCCAASYIEYFYDFCMVRASEIQAISVVDCNCY